MLRYLSEIRFQVLAAIYPRFAHESGPIRKKQAIDVSKLKRLLCYESQHQSQSNEKSLVQFDYEKDVSNYVGTQNTLNELLDHVGGELTSKGTQDSGAMLYIDRYVYIYI